MKLSKRLETKLAKLFLFSAGVAVSVLCINIYFSTYELKNKSANFILNHVKAITQAEVNAQNISEIDKDIHRFYQDWRETQEIDLRIEIFLDNLLIAKAGPLQKFGVFSVSTSKSYALASNQHLQVNIEFDFLRQLILNLITLSIFGVFLFSCYILIKRSLARNIQQITLPLEERVRWLTQVSQNLTVSIPNDVPFEKSNLDEIQNLDESLNSFIQQIQRLEYKIKESGIKEGRFKLAEQLAHTIKGKIALLQLRINNSKDLSFEEKNKLITTVNDIAHASHDILKSGKLNADSHSPNTPIQNREAINIAELIQKIVNKRKETLPSGKDITILCNNSLIEDLFVESSETLLDAAISNVVDNAVEAIKEKGQIQVEVTQKVEFLEILIKDNGCGIPTEVLPKLMKERATFGKSNGNGLGLFHTKNTVENSGGSIQIESELGVGTQVLIKIPTMISAQEKPKSPISIDLSVAKELIVLDDDQSIHESVEYLLKKTKYSALKVLHFYSVDSFEKWMLTNGSGELGDRVYWMDYDLKHSTENGLSLIQKYDLYFEAYLITGIADSTKIQKMSKAQGIRLLSKSQIPHFYFKFNELENSTSKMVLESEI